MLNEWSDREPDPEEGPRAQIGLFLLGVIVTLGGLGAIIGVVTALL